QQPIAYRLRLMPLASQRLLGAASCGLIAVATLLGLACSSSSGKSATAASPTATPVTVCGSLDLLRDDLSDLAQAARSGDRNGATTAIQSALDHVAGLRAAAKQPNSTVSQAADAVSGAVQQLQQTLSQGTQSIGLGATLQFLADQLQALRTALG